MALGCNETGLRRSTLKSRAHSAEQLKVKRKVRTTPMKVPNADLSWTLDFVYFRLAEVFLDAGGELTEETVKDYLPGQVFNLALECDLMPEPEAPAGDGVQLGDCEVTKEYRDAFLDDLPLEMFASRPTSAEGVALSPKQLMDLFKNLSNDYWTLERIAEKIGCDPQTLSRIRNGTRGQEGTLSALATLMNREFPNEFANLPWIHLRWPRTKTPT
jgi:hypothetical protein